MKQVISQRIINLYQQKKGLNVGLVGGLGSGKTFFVRELVEKICPSLKKAVASPTFCLF